MLKAAAMAPLTLCSCGAAALRQLPALAGPVRRIAGSTPCLAQDSPSGAAYNTSDVKAATDEMAQRSNKVMEDLKVKAAAATDKATQRTKEVAAAAEGKVGDAAEGARQTAGDISEKAGNVVEHAKEWVRETAEQAKDKMGQVKDSIKEEARVIKDETLGEPRNRV